MIMPASATIASHQICQIMAKPKMVEKAGMTIPAPLFLYGFLHSGQAF
ncbi:hypothetical protein ACNKHR_05315 [Shigella flexneri]